MKSTTTVPGSKQGTPQESSDRKPDSHELERIARIGSLDESARFNRLKFLLEKSQIYTSILTEKLEAQQKFARDRTDLPEAQNNREVESHVEKPVERRYGKRGKLVNSSYSLANYVDLNELKKNGRVMSTAEALREVDSAETSEDSSCLVKDRRSDPSPLPSARQPTLVTGGYLRDYQLAGVEWLVSLYENGLNGILADEMGLGKTLQTIAFLAFLREKGIFGPYLIVAPLSTLSNWVDEIHRFTPDIPVLLYHGSKEERAKLRKSRLLRTTEPTFPIVVTSYEIIMNDRKYLATYLWKYIVVDEGHRLKNLNCKLIKELKSYQTANRLLLTGTPLQNNLSELWSLLNFLLPDIFDDLESFQSWFDFSTIEAGRDGREFLRKEHQESVIKNLHHILKPFLLRRLKIDVEKRLPPKREYLLFAPLTIAQTELYKAILNKDIGTYLEGVSHPTGYRKRKASQLENTEDGSRLLCNEHRSSSAQILDHECCDQMKLTQNAVGILNRTTGQDRSESSKLEPVKEPGFKHLKLQNTLMSLRKACNHPYQFDWPVKAGTDEYLVDAEIVTQSGKMMLLRRLLVALFDKGHKVLVFSQFTNMLDIIQAWAEDLMQWPTCRIDGSVAQEIRRKLIDDFNNYDICRLFLLSTRSGGLGINLTGADSVILFDSDWNPQQDLQAQDRVHRIGQTKPVIIYRLVSANTVESRILEKAGAKRRLEKLVIQRGKFKSLGAAQASGKEILAELSEIFFDEDMEKVKIDHYDRQVLSDSDLAILLDRSPEAYEKSKGSTRASLGVATFKVVDSCTSNGVDLLATPSGKTLM